MFTKLLRFATAIILILLLAPFNYTNASCSTPSAICGYAESVCLTKLSCTCAFVDIKACSNGERIGWNVCGGMFGPEGYVRINDPVIINIAPVTLPDGTIITKMIQSWSSSSDIPDCNACIQEPTQPPTQIPTDTRVPPTATRIPPTATRVPPTATRIPPTWTYVPPTWTSIPPTQSIVSTLAIPAPSTATAVLSQLLGLQVQPINQLMPEGNKMGNGQIDYGEHNCAIASTAMVLEYFKSQGLLDSNDTTSYLAVRDKLRSQGKNAFPWNDLDTQAIVDLTPQLTHNKLKAIYSCVSPEHFEETIQNELDANRPVIAAVPQWSFLQYVFGGHSIVIYGLQDGKLFYINPWGGTLGEAPIEDYIKDELWWNACPQESLIIMTFELTPTK